MLSGTPIGAEPDVLAVATGEYAPFTDPSAPDGGIVNRRIRQIAEAAGYEVEFRYMPWMRALEQTRSARFAATSFWYYKEDREAEFIHVGPVVRDRVVFFRRSDVDMPDWSRLEDLGGLTVGAVSGYTYTTEFWDLADAGLLNVEIAQSDEANLRKLLAGRIDVYPMSKESGRVLLLRLFSEAEIGRIEVDPRPLMVTEGHLLVSRAAENADELARALQQAVDTLDPLAR